MWRINHLRNQTRVTVVDVATNGAAPTWDMFVGAVGAVRGANFEPNASIHAVRTEVDLAKLKDTTGQYLRPPAILDNLSRLDTTAIPVDLDHGTASNATEAYVAQWDQLLVGMRTDFQVQPINELYVDTGERAIFCYLRADVALARPGAFAVLDGITDAGDFEFRRVLRPQSPPSRPVEHAAVDLRIDRPDLGPGAYTVVRKGDVIPAALANSRRAPLDP